jgi:hypothetical protein
VSSVPARKPAAAKPTCGSLPVHGFCSHPIPSIDGAEVIEAGIARRRSPGCYIRSVLSRVSATGPREPTQDRTARPLTFQPTWGDVGSGGVPSGLVCGCHGDGMQGSGVQIPSAPPFPIRCSCSSAWVGSERRLRCWSDPREARVSKSLHGPDAGCLRHVDTGFGWLPSGTSPSGSRCAAMRRGGTAPVVGAPFSVRRCGRAAAVRCGRLGQARPVQRLGLVLLPVTLARPSLPDGGSADGATGQLGLLSSSLRPPRGHGSAFR